MKNENEKKKYFRKVQTNFKKLKNLIKIQAIIECISRNK